MTQKEGVYGVEAGAAGRGCPNRGKERGEELIERLRACGYPVTWDLEASPRGRGENGMRIRRSDF